MRIAYPVTGEVVASEFEHIGFLPPEIQTGIQHMPDNTVSHIGYISTTGSEFEPDMEYIAYKHWLGYEPSIHSMVISRMTAGYILDDARKAFNTNGPLGLAIELSNLAHPADSSEGPDYEQKIHLDVTPQIDPGTLLYLAASNAGTVVVDGDFVYQGFVDNYEEIDPRVKSLPHRQLINWEVVRSQMIRGLHGRPRFIRPTRRHLLRAMVERR